MSCLIPEALDFASNIVVVNFSLTCWGPFELKVLDSNEFINVDGTFKFEDYHWYSPEGKPDPVEVGKVWESQTLPVNNELCFFSEIKRKFYSCDYFFIIPKLFQAFYFLFFFVCYCFLSSSFLFCLLKPFKFFFSICMFYKVIIFFFFWLLSKELWSNG